jgi:hypothetical protein
MISRRARHHCTYGAASPEHGSGWSSHEPESGTPRLTQAKRHCAATQFESSNALCCNGCHCMATMRRTRLILNTANYDENKHAGQEGERQSQQTTIRTSLRLWQSFPNMFACNMFRCTGFQPGVRVNDGYLQGFSGL